MKTYKAPFKGKTETLLSFCQSITDCHHSTPVYLDEGKLVIRNFNIKGGRLLLENLSYTDETHFNQRISRAKPESGDLIITREAPMGEVCIIPDGVECCLGQRMVLIKPNPKKADNKFLLYSLLSEFIQIQIGKSEGTGSIVSNLRIPVLKELQISSISLSEQKKIGKVLGDIDAKIELNNKINAKLEAMAKLIYDYWFVQFDFPNEHGKPYKSSGGLMVYNEELKREIPEGWEVGTVGSFSKVKKGKLITEKTANTAGNIKVVSAGIDFSYFHDESNYSENTITISASGASAGYINFWHEPIFACDCTTVRGKTEAETLYLLHFLKMRQAYIYQQARGSAQPHVYPKDIEGLKIEIPPEKLLTEFGNTLVSGNGKIAINKKQNQQLASLRDWLLPLLMNGQVWVKEAEEKVRELGLAAEPETDYKTK